MSNVHKHEELDFPSCMSHSPFLGKLGGLIVHPRLTLPFVMAVLSMTAAACILFDTPPTKPVPPLPESMDQTVAVPVTPLPESMDQTVAVPVTPLPESMDQTVAVPVTPLPESMDQVVAVPVTPLPESMDQVVAVPEERARPEVEGGPSPQHVATGFAECIPQALYEHLLGNDLIESLEDLHTANWSSIRDVGTFYVPEVCESVEVVLTAGEYPQIYDDNVFILPIWDDLITARTLNPLDYTKRFYEHFDDEFDFLIVVTSLYQFEAQWMKRSGLRSAPRDSSPRYFPVSNQVRGIGRTIIPLAERGEGPAGKLQGAVRLSTYRLMANQDVLLHELMHRWANYIIPSPTLHWSFMSANGALGEFDLANLDDLGGGEYAVRRLWGGGGSFQFVSIGQDYRTLYYSPIELYLAGFIPADEVPDLWVGEDVEWVRDAAGEVALAEGRYRIFKPSRVRTYTIEDIIAEHGARIPDSSQSQKAFRAAVILLIDENHPATRWQLDQLSSYVDEFSFPGESDDDRDNFYEATGGRATISMGGLSEFLKPDSLRPNSREGEQDLGPPGGRPSVFSSLSAGSKHTCGLTGDHSVFCWGGGEDGQVTPQDGEFSSISAGALHTCGIKMDGSVACWGKDEHGQSTPSGGKFTAVSSGAWHTCGIKMDGSVACWGFDREGQATPPGGEFSSISAGTSHTCGIKRDGSIACWGGIVIGQANAPDDGEFASVSAGGTHACGVKRDGSVTCWGRDARGQATPPQGEFISVSSGLFHTCGVRKDGFVACWGNDRRGQASPPEEEFAFISAGSWHTCGMKRDGSVTCWGSNSDRQATPP